MIVKNTKDNADKREAFRGAFENVDDSFIVEGLGLENGTEREKSDIKNRGKSVFAARLKALSIPKRIAFAALALIIVVSLGITGIASAGGFYDSPEPEDPEHIDPKTGLKRYLTKEEVQEILAEAVEMYENRDPAFDTLTYDFLRAEFKGKVSFNYVDISELEFSRDESLKDLRGKCSYYEKHYFKPIFIMAAKLISERTCAKAWSTLKRTSRSLLPSVFPGDNFYIACSDDLRGYSSMDEFSRKVGTELNKLFYSKQTEPKMFYSYKIDPVPVKWISFEVGLSGLSHCYYVDCSDPDNVEKEEFFLTGTFKELIDYIKELVESGVTMED